MGILLESGPFLMSSIFYLFDNLSLNNFFKVEYTILIKTITYSHNTRVVFKLDNNRLYISCIRGRSREKIFYNADKKLFAYFSQFSFFLNNFSAFNYNAIFRFYFTTENWLHRLPELIRIS